MFPCSGEPTELPSITEWLQRSERSGTELTPIYYEQSGARNSRPTDTDDRVPSTSRGSGSGSRPGIFASDYHARNSVPGMSDPSKFPDKSPLYHFD